MIRVSFFLASLLALGCAQGPAGITWGSAGGDQSNNGSQILLSSPSYAAAMQIIETNCTSCHQATEGPGTVNGEPVYDLTDVGHLVNASLVVPGEPSQSPIYTVISTGAMPPGTSLPSSEAATIQSWILGQ